MRVIVVVILLAISRALNDGQQKSNGGMSAEALLQWEVACAVQCRCFKIGASLLNKVRKKRQPITRRVVVNALFWNRSLEYE